MLQIGDKVRIQGHPGGLFYEQEVELLRIEQKRAKTWLLCDVKAKDGRPRPSWFTSTEVEKVQG